MLTKFKNLYNSTKNRINLQGLLCRIFNKSNLNKFILIFTFGLISRIFIVNFYNINVFTQYFNIISITYYSFFSLFIVVIHEVVNYFNINIIPSFIENFTSHIFELFLYNYNYLKLTISSMKLSYNRFINIKYIQFKPSFIRKYLNIFIQNKDNKIKMSMDNSKDIPKDLNKSKVKPLIPNTHSMEGDFNLYSDGSSNDFSSRGSIGSRGSSGYGYNPNTSNNNSYSNNTTRNNNNSVTNNNDLPSSSNNYPLVNDSTRNDSRFLFTIDTIKASSDVETTQLHSPVKYNPSTPIPSAFTTPSTMTPLFGGSRRTSIGSSNYDNEPLNKNTESYGHEYPVPAQVPYFNPPRESLESNKAVVGLNGSNENIWRDRRDRFASSIDWDQRRYNVESNVAQRYIEQGEKQVVPSIMSGTIPKEIEVKKGLFGKIKLAVNFLDSKLESKISNLDNIAIRYHDKGKRKFFWTIWEKKSGNYESYEDFKNSWNPNTKIWDEIKNKTNKDVRVDVENILGVGRTRPGLNYRPAKEISATRNVDVRTDVNNLIRERQPFARPSPEDTNIDEGNEISHSRSHRRHRSHHHHHKHRNHYSKKH